MSLWKRLWAALPRLGISGLVIALIAGIVAAAYFAALFPDWTGFGPPLLDAQGKELPYKTLWDWLGLLLIPLVLAIGGFFLTRSENRYALQLQERREAEARKLEAERILEARKIEEQRAQDAALQAYLDQMTQLLLHEKLRTSQPEDEVRSVARARTLTVLQVLGNKLRKATVLQFLYEARLIGGIKQEEDDVPRTIDAIVSLDGANLMDANLMGASLMGASLMGANLIRVNLDGANLMDANLNYAVLLGTSLRGTSLQGASLQAASLQAANLKGANLKGADLTNCEVTPEQLAQASSLEGAKLPFDMAPPPAPEGVSQVKTGVL
jgi:hypothetical protein